MGMHLAELWEMMGDRESWIAAVHVIAESYMTGWLNNSNKARSLEEIGGNGLTEAPSLNSEHLWVHCALTVTQAYALCHPETHLPKSLEEAEILIDPGDQQDRDR